MQSNHELNAKPLTTNYTSADTPLKTHHFNKILSHMLGFSSTISTSKVLRSMAWLLKTRGGKTQGQNTQHIPLLLPVCMLFLINKMVYFATDQKSKIQETCLSDSINHVNSNNEFTLNQYLGSTSE